MPMVAALLLLLSPASATPPPTAACQSQLDAWCNLRTSCPIVGRKEGSSGNFCTGPFFALNSSGDPTRPSQHETRWRCFAAGDLDSATHTRYNGHGSCYCTRDEQLRHELCLCEQRGNRSRCPAPSHPTPPPPAPSPPPQPPPAVPQLRFTDVIVANDTIRSCYRNPVMTLTASGDLLCFIEERSRGGRQFSMM
jgi:hypothetical protein